MRGGNPVPGGSGPPRAGAQEIPQIIRQLEKRQLEKRQLEKMGEIGAVPKP